MRYRALHRVLVLVLGLMCWQISVGARAQPIVLDFDDLSAMQYFPLAQVPPQAQLSDQYLKKHGVRFSSARPYVAVSLLGPNHAVSGTNAIAGADANGILTYDHVHPIVAKFFDPKNPTIPATIDFVSVRLDLWGGNSTVVLKAFSINGELIDSCTVIDRGGEAMKVSGVGIHYVEFHGGMGVALDDFTFSPVTVPGTGLAPMNRNDVERAPIEQKKIVVAEATPEKRNDVERAPIEQKKMAVAEAMPDWPAEENAPLIELWLLLLLLGVILILGIAVCLAGIAVFLFIRNQAHA